MCDEDRGKINGEHAGKFGEIEWFAKITGKRTGKLLPIGQIVAWVRK
jgi:hypothetical protein